MTDAIAFGRASFSFYSPEEAEEVLDGTLSDEKRSLRIYQLTMLAEGCSEAELWPLRAEDGGAWQPPGDAWRPQ